MWILTASFDEAQIGDKTAQSTFKYSHSESLPTVVESKLLKTGKTYVLGRKDQPLVIKDARISKNHAAFQVGSCTEDEIVGCYLMFLVNPFTGNVVRPFI